MRHFYRAELGAYGGPGEQVNFDTWVDGPDAIDRGEQVRWGFIDIEAGKTVIGGCREGIAYV